MGPTYSVESKRYGNQRESTHSCGRRAGNECLCAGLQLDIDS